MNITLNGAETRTEQPDLAALVDSMELTSSSLVIEQNGSVISQSCWSQTPVREGDVIELLNFVGGG